MYLRSYRLACMAWMAMSVFIAIPLIMVGGCSGSGHTSSPETSTAVSATASYNSGIAGSACAGALTWNYKMISLGDGVGRSTAFSRTDTYSISPNSYGSCAYGDGELDMHPGTWRISVLNLSCTVVLTPDAGDQSVNMNRCNHPRRRL